MKRILLVLPFVLAACDSGLTAPPENVIPTVASLNLSGGTCLVPIRGVMTIVRVGFDEFGYNRCAHNFVGTFGGWCTQRSLSVDCGGVTGDTRLNMKWNEGWDVGNATGWSKGPYDAWLDNEIRGTDLSGVAFSEHFKTKWDQACADGSVSGTDGGPCIWGSFEVLMDQGTENGAHVWWTKLSPAGFGS